MNWFVQILDPLADEAPGAKTMRKSAKMTARIALSFVVICVLLLIISIYNFGVSKSTPLICGMTLLFGVIVLLNTLRQATVAGLLLSNLPSLLVLCITLYLKSQSPGDDLHYFDSRIILIGFCALPGMIFSRREPVRMYFSAAFNLLVLSFYDPIHEWLGLGYFQQGFANATYYHINTISILVALSIVAGTTILKGIVVEEEDVNMKLLIEKENQNQELETQNEEISSQSEQLAAALLLIESQKKELEKYTNSLEDLVDVKNNELQRTNEALQKYNGELRQFSYTVSHNLRGPVARLLGLSRLIDYRDDGLSADNRKYTELLSHSAEELDQIIRELSRIIDIRNDLYVLKEKVLLEEEWTQVYHSLSGQIGGDVKFVTDFSAAPFLYTIRPFLHSILYNLTSNAIRYRSPQRPLQVSVRSTLSQGQIRITVSDNGLGINLEQFGNNIFGMYKRFHTHVEGRGLGLYLVKTQTEALHGEVRVESKLNAGTTFHIDIPLPIDIEGQVCFDCDYGTILYNARTDTMGLLWKREPSSEEYRAVLIRCLEMLHTYQTANWIADIRKRGILSADDNAWFGEQIMNEGARNGLKKIACIDVPGNDSQRSSMSSVSKPYGVDIQFFYSRTEAEQWLER